MNKLAKIAERETLISHLIEGREKLVMDEIIKGYPDGVTVTGVDVVTMGDDSFPVVLFKEDESKFFFGGLVMMKIIDKWLEAYGGDFDAVNADLAADGVKLKFEKFRTKTGNACTKIKVIG